MIKEVLVSRNADRYLEKHQIKNLFLKAIRKIEKDQSAGLDFKKREPKSLSI